MSTADDLKKLRLKTQIGITSVLGVVSIYILLTQPDNSSLQKWAIGTLGIIVGYWLK